MNPPAGGDKHCQRFGCGNTISYNSNQGPGYAKARHFCSVTCANKARTKPIMHGTYGGYMAHHRRNAPFRVGGKDCGCRAAARHYHRPLNERDSEYRNLRSAASRAAKAALTRLYPDDYARLRQEHLGRLLAERATERGAGASSEAPTDRLEGAG